jgi:GT2 family glycosyltransferase
MTLNDELLVRLGLRWDSLLSARWNLLDSPSFVRYRDRIIELLHRDFESSRLFVLKDPRLCRLLPIWRSALEQFGAEPKCILIIRHPLDVAGSLAARNGIPLQSGLLIWLRHVLEAESGSRDLNRVFVSYERLLNDWRAAALRISQVLNIEWLRTATETASEIDAFLERDSQHHILGELIYNGVDAAGPIPAVRRIYEVAYAAACGDTTDVTATFDELRVFVSEAESLIKPIISESQRLAVDNERLQADSLQLRSESQSLAEDNERLRADSLQLRSESQSLAIDNGRLQADVLRLRSESQDLAVDNERLRAESLLLRSESQNLAVDNARLRADSLQIRSESQSLAVDNGRLQAELKVRNEEVAAAHKELERVRTWTDSMSETIAQRNAELERVRTWTDSMSKTIIQCNAELKRVRTWAGSMSEAIVQRNAELERIRTWASSMSETIAQRDAELLSLTHETAQLHQMELELRRVATERQRLLGRLGTELLELRGCMSWRLTAPVRETYRFWNRLRRALWPYKHRFGLQPARQLASVDSIRNIWEAQGSDPQFLLTPMSRSRRYPTRWCEVRISLKDLDGPQQMVLYADDGGGFAGSRALALPPPTNGQTRAVIELPGFTRALRLDPSQQPGCFEIKNVVIREISRGKAKQLKRQLDREVSAASAFGHPSANGDAYAVMEVSADQQPSANGSGVGLMEVSTGEQPPTDGGMHGLMEVSTSEQSSPNGNEIELMEVSTDEQPPTDGDTRGLMEVSTSEQSSPNGDGLELTEVSAGKQPSANGGGLELDVKVFVRERLKAEFGTFLASGAELVLPQPQSPLTSIVLVLYNQAELTYNCLCSIVAHAGEDAEIIIIDNASSDATAELLQRVHGAIVVRNTENRYFPAACNQASEHARGKYLLLLNNDAQLLPGSLQAAIGVLEQDESIGAVGGRILSLTGCLQEAGSIVWSDGSTLGYGRGDICDRPQYMFRREVDFCSAAFMLTRTRLFRETGGFDEVFSPGYYEEVDFCVRLWEHDLRVVYEPCIAIVHFEYGSSDPAFAGTMIARNRQIMCFKHADYLAKRKSPDPKNELRARHAHAPRLRILFIDDCTPHLDQGSGYPRANAIVNAMIRMGAAVTLFPMNQSEEPWQRVYRDLLREIEVMADASANSLGAFLKERRGEYDVIFVSRPHNMQYLLNVLGDRSILNGARLIYDAEAVFALRTQEKARVVGQGDSEAAARELAEELDLAGKADEIICVSDVERRHFVEHGLGPVHILGHSIEPKPSTNTFEERHDILFVGAMHGPDSPNEDSVLWFSKDVLPLVRARLASADVRLIVVGQNTVQRLSALADDTSIELVGSAEDLSPYYERARIFVGPTRFAAGIPIKIVEAAARGVPIVVTSLLATQLGWVNGEQLLTAPATDPEKFADQCVRLYSDKELWSCLREKAFARVRDECSPERFAENLGTILAQCTALKPDRRETTDANTPSGSQPMTFDGN